MTPSVSSSSSEEKDALGVILFQRQKPDGGHGNGVMTTETETRYPTEVQQSQQCYPDSGRLLEEPGSVLSDLRVRFGSFARQ